MQIIFNEIKEKDIKKLQTLFNVSENQIEITKNAVTITLFELSKITREQVYRLKQTDTLHNVARKFNVPEGAILRENVGIVFDKGVAIIVPKNDKTSYTVKPLDTFMSVATKFNTTEEKIKKDNNVDYIYAGQIIFI